MKRKTKSAVLEGKRQRILLYSVRAVIWLLMGFCLEFSTSIFADGIYQSVARSDSILGIALILLVAILAIIFNSIKARKSRPIYSMDNDLSTGLFVVFAVSGSFIENLLAGSAIEGINEWPEKWQYLLAGGLLVAGILFMVVDITGLDRLYEKINDFPNVDFQYKVNANKSESYVKAVLRVNVAWIIVPVIVAIICSVWMALVILI